MKRAPRKEKIHWSSLPKGDTPSLSKYLMREARRGVSGEKKKNGAIKNEHRPGRRGERRMTCRLCGPNYQPRGKGGEVSQERRA